MSADERDFPGPESLTDMDAVRALRQLAMPPANTLVAGSPEARALYAVLAGGKNHVQCRPAGDPLSAAVILARYIWHRTNCGMELAVSGQWRLRALAAAVYGISNGETPVFLDRVVNARFGNGQIVKLTLYPKCVTLAFNPELVRDFDQASLELVMAGAPDPDA